MIQVTLLRQLLATDPTATPEQLSVRFCRKNPKRTEQIEGIIETLRGLGQVYGGCAPHEFHSMEKGFIIPFS